MLHSDTWACRPQAFPQLTTGSHSGVCTLTRAGSSRGLANSVDLSGSHNVYRFGNAYLPLIATVLMYVAGCGSKLCKRPDGKGPSRVSTIRKSAIEQMQALRPWQQCAALSVTVFCPSELSSLYLRKGRQMTTFEAVTVGLLSHGKRDVTHPVRKSFRCAHASILAVQSCRAGGAEEDRSETYCQPLSEERRLTACIQSLPPVRLTLSS